VMWALVVVPYLLVLTGTVTGWGALGLCALVGVGLAGVGFAVGHDAIHGAYSRRRWVNGLAGLSFEMAGASRYMWRLTHNRIHHTFTNIHGMDTDISPTPLLRVCPGAPYRKIHRWQHWFAWAVYGLTSLSWVFRKDYIDWFSPTLGPLDDNRPRRASTFAQILLWKAVHYGWTIVLPLVILQPSILAFLAGFLVMHVTAGVLLGIVFQLAHVVEETEFPVPSEDRALEDDWFVHQMRTTADFARGNRLLGWFVGGLNFQVEHHLFPHVCSIHYPAISPIVEDCARRHGVPYHAQPTFWGAVRSHARALRRLGRPATA
jgi:linoleoyl-CoA desaturase